MRSHPTVDTVVCVTRSAVLYARQSIDHGEGIERQRARCITLIESRGWTLVGEYCDNDTSATKDRGAGTQWAAMLDAAKRKRFDAVVAVDLDRLLRQTRDLVTLTDLKIPVLTVDGELDLTTADGEFRATMLAGIARFETARKSERQLRANAARAAQGRPVPGRRRFGFENGNQQPRPEEAAVVRSLFDGFAAGSSIRSLAQAIDWRPRRVRDVLANPSYAGQIVYHGDRYDSSVPAIVPRALFDRVQLLLSDPTRKTTPGPAVRHLMSGIARCADCGSTLVYMRAYRCQTAASHPSILKPKLESAVIAALLDVLSSQREVEGDTPDLADLLAQRADLARQRQQAQELALLPGADMVFVARTLKSLAAQLDQVDAVVAETRAAAATVGLASVLTEEWRRFGYTQWSRFGQIDLFADKQVPERFEEWFTGLGLEQQRALVAGTFSKIVVGHGRDASRITFSDQSFKEFTPERG